LVPHVLGGGQVPQSSNAPQPSDTLPHWADRLAQVSGVHAVAPHLFGPAPPQNGRLAGHSPQSTVPPHSSGIVPQSAPAASQVRGTQPSGAEPPVPALPLLPPVPALPPGPAEPSSVPENSNDSKPEIT
jgi:hypothetical protein